MSKPDLRAIVDVKIDWITQKVLLDDYDCHQTDEWKLHQRGSQDCLMDRFHLCGSKLGGFGDSSNWDFTHCLFMNRVATYQIDDKMRGFNATVDYCSYLWGLDTAALTKCAYSDEGRALLEASHQREVKQNPYSPRTSWIMVNGANHISEFDTDWGQLVCDAYTGPQPASCPGQTNLRTLFS